MDILTHTMMGLIAAAPLVEHYPLVAVCVAVGSVLPDIDALSRTFGRRAFLLCHQSYTHSLPGIALFALGCWLLLVWLELPGPLAQEVALAPWALAAGMLLHSLTDLSNTFGVMLIAPLNHRRRSLEWVFFIDGFVIAASLVTLGGLAWSWELGGGVARWAWSIGYFAILAGYWAMRGWLRGRAGRQAPPQTLSLLPSALWPHRFLGCGRAPGGQAIEIFEWDAWRGERRGEVRRIEVLDGGLEEELALLPEYRVMRALSPAYHVVEARDDGGLVCRDLRTRNFETRFGQLDLRRDDEGRLRVERWHV